MLQEYQAISSTGAVSTHYSDMDVARTIIKPTKIIDVAVKTTTKTASNLKIQYQQSAVTIFAMHNASVNTMTYLYGNGSVGSVGTDISFEKKLGSLNATR